MSALLIIALLLARLASVAGRPAPSSVSAALRSLAQSSLPVELRWSPRLVNLAQERVALLADQGTCDQAALAIDAVHDMVFVLRVEGSTAARQAQAPFLAWLAGINDQLHAAVQQDASVRLKLEVGCSDGVARGAGCIITFCTADVDHTEVAGSSGVATFTASARRALQGVVPEWFTEPEESSSDEESSGEESSVDDELAAEQQQQQTVSGGAPRALLGELEWDPEEPPAGRDDEETSSGSGGDFDPQDEAGVEGVDGGDSSLAASGGFGQRRRVLLGAMPEWFTEPEESSADEEESSSEESSGEESSGEAEEAGDHSGADTKRDESAEEELQVPPVDAKGVITDPRHPGYKQFYDEWVASTDPNFRRRRL